MTKVRARIAACATIATSALLVYWGAASGFDKSIDFWSVFQSSTNFVRGSLTGVVLAPFLPKYEVVYSVDPLSSFVVLSLLYFVLLRPVSMKLWNARLTAFLAEQWFSGFDSTVLSPITHQTGLLYWQLPERRGEKLQEGAGSEQAILWQALTSWVNDPGAGDGRCDFWTFRPRIPQQFSFATITASTGVGKTQLAYEFARKIARRELFGDSQASGDRPRKRIRAAFAETMAWIRNAIWFLRRSSDDPWDVGFYRCNDRSVAPIEEWSPRRPTLIIMDDQPFDSYRRTIETLGARAESKIKSLRHPVRLLIIDQATPPFVGDVHNFGVYKHTLCADHSLSKVRFDAEFAQTLSPMDVNAAGYATADLWKRDKADLERLVEVTGGLPFFVSLGILYKHRIGSLKGIVDFDDIASQDSGLVGERAEERLLADRVMDLGNTIEHALEPGDRGKKLLAIACATLVGGIDLNKMSKHFGIEFFAEESRRLFTQTYGSRELPAIRPAEVGDRFIVDFVAERLSDRDGVLLRIVEAGWALNPEGMSKALGRLSCKANALAIAVRTIPELTPQVALDVASGFADAAIWARGDLTGAIDACNKASALLSIEQNLILLDRIKCTHVMPTSREANLANVACVGTLANHVVRVVLQQSATTGSIQRGHVVLNEHLPWLQELIGQLKWRGLMHEKLAARDRLVGALEDLLSAAGNGTASELGVAIEAIHTHVVVPISESEFFGRQERIAICDAACNAIGVLGDRQNLISDNVCFEEIWSILFRDTDGWDTWEEAKCNGDDGSDGNGWAAQMRAWRATGLARRALFEGDREAVQRWAWRAIEMSGQFASESRPSVGLQNEILSAWRLICESVVGEHDPGKVGELIEKADEFANGHVQDIEIRLLRALARRYLLFREDIGLQAAMDLLKELDTIAESTPGDRDMQYERAVARRYLLFRKDIGLQAAMDLLKELDTIAGSYPGDRDMQYQRALARRYLLFRKDIGLQVAMDLLKELDTIAGSYPGDRDMQYERALARRYLLFRKDIALQVAMDRLKELDTIAESTPGDRDMQYERALVRRHLLVREDIGLQAAMDRLKELDTIAGSYQGDRDMRYERALARGDLLSRKDIGLKLAMDRLKELDTIAGSYPGDRDMQYQRALARRYLLFRKDIGLQAAMDLLKELDTIAESTPGDRDMQYERAVARRHLLFRKDIGLQAAMDRLKELDTIAESTPGDRDMQYERALVRRHLLVREDIGLQVAMDRLKELDTIAGSYPGDRDMQYERALARRYLLFRKDIALQVAMDRLKELDTIAESTPGDRDMQYERVVARRNLLYRRDIALTEAADLQNKLDTIAKWYPGDRDMQYERLDSYRTAGIWVAMTSELFLRKLDDIAWPFSNDRDIQLVRAEAITLMLNPSGLFERHRPKESLDGIVRFSEEGVEQKRKQLLLLNEITKEYVADWDMQLCRAKGNAGFLEYSDISFAEANDSFALVKECYVLWRGLEFQKCWAHAAGEFCKFAVSGAPERIRDIITELESSFRDSEGNNDLTMALGLAVIEAWKAYVQDCLLANRFDGISEAVAAIERVSHYCDAMGELKPLRLVRYVWYQQLCQSFASREMIQLIWLPLDRLREIAQTDQKNYGLGFVSTAVKVLKKTESSSRRSDYWQAVLSEMEEIGREDSSEEVQNYLSQARTLTSV